MAKEKKKDKSRVVLRVGEIQRNDGTYQYSWMDANRKRRYVYAKNLDDLRAKEEQIAKDKSNGIKTEARYTTVNELYELWKVLKRGLKDNTFENYQYMYETFVRPKIGQQRISNLKKSDIKRYYNYLADERGLKASTKESIYYIDLECFSEGDLVRLKDFEGNTITLNLEGWFCPERGTVNEVYVNWYENAKRCSYGGIYISYGDYEMTEDDIPIPYVEDELVVNFKEINNKLEAVVNSIFDELEQLENQLIEFEI